MGTSPGRPGRGSQQQRPWGLSLLLNPCCPHLGQASEEAGPAGRAAAHGGEGIAEDKAPAGQGIQVRGGDGTVVVGTTLKASVIR